MTLSSEMLPAMQHYALLAAALALFSLSLTHLKRRFSIWVWLVVVVLPFIQMAWSLLETISEVVAVEGIKLESREVCLIVGQALAHGVAIVLVLVVVLRIASQSKNEMPKRVRLEPTIGPPSK